MTETRLRATAHVPTAHASRYLQQLCKHWSHKLAVTFDATHGHVPLPMGPAEFHADDATLTIHCAAATPDDLALMQQIVVVHLNRFAFREGELVFDWQPA